MSLLCLAGAAVAIALPLQSFTLAWTHSIEKLRWEEDYRIVGTQLELVEARVRGSGAGMEAPPGAVLHDGAWRYRPALPLLPRLRLARSGFVPDYELCADARCQSLSAIVGRPENAPELEVFPCSATR